MKPHPDVEFAAFAGIDWADAKHDICLQAANSEDREFVVLAHRSAAIEAWAGALRQRFAEVRFSGALPDSSCHAGEIPRGVRAESRQGGSHRRATRSGTAASLPRQAESPHTAKRSDAHAAAAGRTATSPGGRPNPHQQSADRRTEAILSRCPRLVSGQGHAPVLRLSQSLVDAKQLKNARRATLLSFFHEHHVRSQARIEERLRAIKAATTLTDDLAVISPNQLLVLTLVEQLRVTLQAIERFDAEIATVSESLPDYSLFRALPGAGASLAPRLLAAFGEQRERYQSAAEIQRYTGIAPVTESSGKKRWVHWRLQCPTFVRQTFVEWAGATIPRSFWAAAYYRQQRDKGCSHQAAVRALAFKWIRILYRCWQSRTPYDEATYLNALSRRGSPLLASITEVAKNT